MKIYHLNWDIDKYDMFAWDKVDIDLIQSFKGTKRMDTWVPVRIKRMPENLELSNAPYLTAHIPIVDHEAMSALGSLLTDNAELLPLDCEVSDFFAVNVTKVIDALDHEKSEYKKFSNSNRIMFVFKYAFREDMVKDLDLFKLIDEPLSYAFVSERFKQRVEEQGLTGFKFDLVWDSEESLESE